MTADALRRELLALGEVAVLPPGWTEAATITPLPGGTRRRSFAVDGPGLRAVLRLPGAGPGDSASLVAEAAAVSAAADSGAGPDLLGVTGTALLVARAPGNALAVGDLADADRRERVVRAFARLHAAGGVPGRGLDLTVLREVYRAELAASGGREPAGYAEILARLAPLEQALAAAPGPVVLCHGDAVPDNVVDDGARAWLIDLEFAVAAEAEYDLGCLADAATDDAAAAAALTAELAAPGAAARARAWAVLARAAWLPWALLPGHPDTPRVHRWADVDRLVAAADLAPHEGDLGA